MLLYNAFGCVLAFLITTGCIKLMTPLALRLGLVDEPGGRKQHERQIPLLGGVAMFLGFTFAMLALPISLIGYRPFASASLLLIIVGLLDDMHEVSPRTRFVVEVLAALIMAWVGHVVLQQLGNILGSGDIYLGFLAVPCTLLATVAIINGMNMLDGNDGLAGSIMLGQLFLLFLLCCRIHNFVDASVLLFLICALLGFLGFNFPGLGRSKAEVFMGDSGTMFLGFVLTWFCIHLSQGPHATATPITFLWVMALPIWDTTRVILWRLYARTSPFKPDRLHLHHILLLRGFKPPQVSWIMSTLSLSLGLIGVIGYIWGVSESNMFLSFLAGFVFYGVVFRKNTIEFAAVPAEKTGTASFD